MVLVTFGVKGSVVVQLLQHTHTHTQNAIHNEILADLSRLNDVDRQVVTNLLRGLVAEKLARTRRHTLQNPQERLFLKLI